VYNIPLLGVVGVYRVDEKASNRHHSKMITPLSKISEVEHYAPSKEQVQRTGGRRIPTEVHLLIGAFSFCLRKVNNWH
jgi:hypothetical protein